MSDQPPPSPPDEHYPGAQLATDAMRMSGAGGFAGSADPDLLIAIMALEDDLLPTDKKDKLKERLWTFFSKILAITNLDVDRFYIVNEWADAIMLAYSMGFKGFVRTELTKFYVYVKSSESYNGFTFMGLTQKHLKIDYPTPVVKEKRGFLGIGGQRREQP